jgi:hypothetical protein
VRCRLPDPAGGVEEKKYIFKVGFSGIRCDLADFAGIGSRDRRQRKSETLARVSRTVWVTFPGSVMSDGRKPALDPNPSFHQRHCRMGVNWEERTPS